MITMLGITGFLAAVQKQDDLEISVTVKLPPDAERDKKARVRALAESIMVPDSLERFGR